MKVGELRSARERLTRAYDALEAETASFPPAEAVTRLASGLAALEIGSRPLHPEIANLEVAAGSGDAALVRRTEARLRATIRQGRARADLMPVLGGLLGEWLSPDRKRPGVSPDELAELVSPWREPSAQSAAPLIARLEARMAPEVLARARERVREESTRALDDGEVSPLGEGHELLNDEGKGDASATRELTDESELNPLHREVAEALRLHWRQVESWDWPETGQVVSPIWTRNRYRLRPKLDLINASIVEALGRAVERALAPIGGPARLSRLLRLRRLEELEAPDVIVNNERRMLDDTVDAFGWLGSDHVGGLGTFERLRVDMRLVAAPSHDYAYASTEIGRLFAYLSTEIAIARAHDRPLFVLKTDVRDFYPSVSHALIEELLVWLDLDPRLVTLTRRLLAQPLPGGQRAARGLPMGLGLSRALEDMVMSMVVGEMRAAANVRVVRLVDDLIVLADDPSELVRAWTTLQDTLADAGLEVQLQKTGAAAFGAPLPAEVPQGPVRWGMLALDDEGSVVVDGAAVDQLVALTAARVAGHEALLDRVACWRDQLQYLWTWLAPRADLGHLDGVANAVASLSDLVIDDGSARWSSMREMLRGEVERRFLGGVTSTLPDAWLYWPLTAGGLGLSYPPADLVPLRLARDAKERSRGDVDGAPRLPEPVEHPERDADWGKWAASQLEPLEATVPVETPAAADELKRFVERGTRLGRPATELAGYWRWVLHTLGPDIVEAYGSYDFVATDLIPVQLIRGL
ncbi:MAG: hypothetical protein KC731_01980 [Myxococcales bacterium]|nr:hypothetical protein [Myxococcales bacterium]